MSIHFYVCFIDLILLNLRYDRGVKIYAKLFWYATYAGTCAVFRNHNPRCFTHSWHPLFSKTNIYNLNIPWTSAKYKEVTLLM